MRPCMEPVWRASCGNLPLGTCEHAEKRDISMLVQRIFISGTIHHQESDYCIQGKANTLYSCTHTNRSTGTPSSNATQPGLCLFAALALARAKFNWPGKSCTCCKNTDSDPPPPPSVSTPSSTIL